MRTLDQAICAGGSDGCPAFHGHYVLVIEPLILIITTIIEACTLNSFNARTDFFFNVSAYNE